MLHINSKQFDALKRARREQFVVEMTEHCSTRFPHTTEPLGTDHLGRIIRQRVAKALDAGYRLRGSVRLQLELGFIFGVDFADDPQFPWATEILNLPDVVTEQRKSRKLYDAARSYLSEVHGPDERHVVKALQRLEVAAQAGFVTSFGNMAENFFWLLENIFPEKAHQVGRAPMERLLDRANEVSAAFDMTKTPHRLLVAALMLTFGHGCFRDEVQPWISASVDDASASGDEHAERLARRALTRLKVVNRGKDQIL